MKKTYSRSKLSSLLASIIGIKFAKTKTSFFGLLSIWLYSGLFFNNYITRLD